MDTLTRGYLLVACSSKHNRQLSQVVGLWVAVSAVRWLHDYKKSDLIKGLKMLTAKALSLASPLWLVLEPSILRLCSCLTTET